MKLNKTHFRPIIAADATATMSKNARGATISFRFRHCESSRSFALVVTSMLTN